MTAPMLIAVHDAHPEVQGQLPALPDGPTVRAFVVCRGGQFGGHDFDAGDVVVCRGAADDGELVVLVASGHGRPRLGSVDGRVVRGDAGEPCHGDRWRMAGKLAAVYRETGHGWVVDLVDGAPVEPEVARLAPAPQLVSSQLSLFGSAQAA